MLISLIVTSRGNRLALRRLFNSISFQTGIELKNIEVIFADQANDKSLIDTYANKFKIIYLKIPLSSLSSARNQVLKYITGNIVGFPDDDCWYPSSFLSKVVNQFKKDPLKAMWCCNIKDPTNNEYYGNRPKVNATITNKNIYYLPSSVSMFINLNIVNFRHLHFNEFLGVGTKWGAGEDVELAFNIYKKYNNSSYDGTINVYHPVVIGGDTQLKAFSYGKGSGALAALLTVNKNYKHLTIFLKYINRSILGATYYLLTFNLKSYKVYFSRLKGLVTGYILGYIFFSR